MIVKFCGATTAAEVREMAAAGADLVGLWHGVPGGGGGRARARGGPPARPAPAGRGGAPRRGPAAPPRDSGETGGTEPVKAFSVPYASASPTRMP
ncbi:hypothetical protein ACFV23_36635, partial [Streptomyces sp. NPDC059627]